MVSGGSGLSDSELYDILANERRRIALGYLLNRDGTVQLADLADEVAAREVDESPAPAPVRQSVYTTLRKSHIPKLESHGIVSFDDESTTVTLEDGAFDVSVEVVPRHELSWSEYYLAIGVLGLLTGGLSVLGVPALTVLDPAGWALLYFALYVVSSAVHLRSRDRRLLQRASQRL